MRGWPKSKPHISAWVSPQVYNWRLPISKQGISVCEETSTIINGDRVTEREERMEGDKSIKNNKDQNFFQI